MEKIIIFGTNNFSNMFYDYVTEDKIYEVCCFTVDKEYIVHDSWNGLPLVPFEKIQETYSPDEYKVMICLGYNKMNDFRKDVFCRVRKKGYQIVGYTHPSAIVLAEEMGEGNLIMEGAVIGSECRLGEGNIISTSVMLGHNSEVGNYNFFAGAGAVGGNAVIKNNCMFGLNCTVKHEVTVEDYTLVGAGAYINNNTEKAAVYVPARSVKLEGKTSFDLSI